MTIGKIGNRVFVNSGHSLSREKVEDLFPEAGADGSIPWALVEGKFGRDAVVGRVAIREEFRGLYAAEIGHLVGAMRARQILRGYPYEKWRGIEVTRVNALRVWAEDKAKIRKLGIEARTRTDSRDSDVSSDSSG